MGLIKESFIENIYESVDIVEVVRSQCPDLKKRGKSWFCKSPFTDEKSASFAVDAAKQIFKCFSSGIGGGAITFIRELKGLTFPEAIHWLAEFKNMQVEYENAEWAKKSLELKNKKEDVRPLLKSALNKYQKELWSLPATHPAHIELKKRNYDIATAKEWGIGYAPGKDFIYSEVSAIGKTTEAREIFLIGDTQDKFWNRLIFPIHDKNDLLIGFAGRDLSNRDNSAKWINPADSIL
jgi:DNA primase